MTIDTFVEELNGDIYALEYKKYISVEEKLGVINGVLENYIDSNGRITATYNSVSLEIAKIISAINLYTNLDIKSLADYDFLAENDMVDLIIKNIGKDVYYFYQYFDDRKTDCLREKNSFDGIFSRFMGEIGKIMESFDPKMLEELLSSLNIGE